MVDVIIVTCQSRRKILYTTGLGFMLILGLQGLPGGPKKCIQPYTGSSGVSVLVSIHSFRRVCVLGYCSARRCLQYYCAEVLPALYHCLLLLTFIAFEQTDSQQEQCLVI